jgi:hypothetical protein
VGLVTYCALALTFEKEPICTGATLPTSSWQIVVA